jgi:hypothetical protein
VEAADEPIDFDDADAVVAAVEEEMGSRPAMTPRVVTAVVDLPAADAAATDEDEDAAAVRAAPLAKAADSFEVLLLLGESSVSASLSSSSWGLVPSEWLMLMAHGSWFMSHGRSAQAVEWPPPAATQK